MVCLGEFAPKGVNPVLPQLLHFGQAVLHFCRTCYVIRPFLILFHLAYPPINYVQIMYYVWAPYVKSLHKGGDAPLLPSIHHYRSIRSILYRRIPTGTSISTISLIPLPSRALPTGDSLEILCAEGSASADPTIVYTNSSLVSRSVMQTFEPRLTLSVCTLVVNDLGVS